jgi:hypothetical protein
VFSRLLNNLLVVSFSVLFLWKFDGGGGGGQKKKLSQSRRNSSASIKFYCEHFVRADEAAVTRGKSIKKDETSGSHKHELDSAHAQGSECSYAESNGNYIYFLIIKLGCLFSIP